MFEAFAEHCFYIFCPVPVYMMSGNPKSDSCAQPGNSLSEGHKYLNAACFPLAALLIIALAFSSMYRLSSTYDENAHYRFGRDLLSRELKGASW